MDALVLSQLLRIVSKHEKAFAFIDPLLVVAATHAALLEPLLDRCACTDCTSAATVEHNSLGMQCCDNCCARLVVKAQNKLQSDNADAELTAFHVSMGAVENWVDLKNAVEVRHLQSYLTRLRNNDEVEVVVH